MIKAITEGREAPEGEARILTPQWALDMAAELAREDVSTIRALGVSVIGDLESLSEHLVSPRDVVDSSGNTIPIDAAVAAILGAMSPASTPTPDVSLADRLRTKVSSILRRRP